MPLFFYDTDIGRIGIEEKKGEICGVYFKDKRLPQEVDIYETEILKEASYQLNKYLSGKLKTFSLPLAPSGTGFMQEVWQLICEIPYGKTFTYKELAEKVGRPKAARAIGLACNRNPIPIFIPCHRVVGSNGKLNGYLGGIDIKERLLLLEAKQ